jgi:putative ABC transport system ATP-binding protein
MTALIECRGLGRVFEAGGQRFHALRNVDLTIEAGELVAIVGASGSGKSTLLNALGGLDRPTEGDVRIDGRSLTVLSEPELADLRNRTIGFVFQQFNLLPRFDALRNVELPLLYAGAPRAARRERAMELLRQVGLGDHVHKRPPQMSGGQQQRVAIARALANRPGLILADEPTGALDSATGAEVIEMLVQLNREQSITVAIVTHDLQIAARCRRCIRFADGVVVLDQQNQVPMIRNAANDPIVRRDLG